jgi:hypothetical protein
MMNRRETRSARDRTQTVDSVLPEMFFHVIDLGNRRNGKGVKTLFQWITKSVMSVSHLYSAAPDCVRLY